jgi:hypothetical protein
MKKYAGDEPIEFKGLPVNPPRSLGDFWRFMYSDILSASVGYEQLSV